MFGFTQIRRFMKAQSSKYVKCRFMVVHTRTVMEIVSLVTSVRMIAIFTGSVMDKVVKMKMFSLHSVKHAGRAFTEEIVVVYVDIVQKI